MSKHSLINALIDIGLSKMNAQVYIATLELGEGIASDIAKKAKLKRPTVYVVLKDLQKQGIISSYTRRKITRFVAIAPEKLIARMDEKVKKAETVLPELKALYKDAADGRPSIQFYEGVDGLISIMEDTLVEPNKTIKGWVNADLAWNTLSAYYPTYIKKKNEQNISVQGFFVDNETGRLFDKRKRIENREAILIPESKFPITNEINIYDDKIFIISHKDLMGVIIENKEIAATQRAIFDFCWSLAARDLA